MRQKVKLDIENIADAAASQIFGGTRISTKSFQRFGDKNNITNGMRLAWFSQDGQPLDRIAKELKATYGSLNKYDEQEVIEGIVSFITAHPTGKFVKAYMETRLDQQDYDKPIAGSKKTDSKPEKLSESQVECLVKKAKTALKLSVLQQETADFLKSPQSYFGALLEVPACKKDLFSLPINEQIEVVTAMQKALQPKRPMKGNAEPKQVSIHFVNHKSEESKVFRRLVGLSKKSTKETVFKALKALQKAILARLIRKTSPFAAEIEQVQTIYIKLLNKAKAPYQVKLTEEELDKYVLLAGGEQVYQTVQICMMAMQFVDQDGTVRLSKDQAISKLKKLGKINIKPTDPYSKEAQEFLRYIKEVATSGNGRKYTLKPALSGLNCACQEKQTKVNGLGALPTMMSAADMMNVSYQTLLFEGDYQKLIGKPQVNFSLMVWGNPGSGKSTFSLGFANYLASKFGKVAYLSSEEYGSYTLQDKLKRVGSISDKLFFIKDLAQFNKDFQFLVIDSVNNFGLELEQFTQLRKQHPSAGIILVMQATKGGQFKGSKAWEHDVDTVIELDNGKAFTTKNRFAALSEIKVF